MGKRKKRKKRKKLKMTHIILLFLMVYISVVMINQRKMMKELQSKKSDVENEINTIQRDINSLNKEIENSDSLEFIEKTAREELGMVKPREIIYIDKEKKKNSLFKIFERDSNWLIFICTIY